MDFYPPGGESRKETCEKSGTHYFHKDHTALPPPPQKKKKLHNHCFQFLPGNTVVPREIQDNGYATMPPRYYDQDSMVQPWWH